MIRDLCSRATSKNDRKYASKKENNYFSEKSPRTPIADTYLQHKNQPTLAQMSNENYAPT